MIKITKVMAVAGGKKVFTHQGFKDIDKIADSEIWLFSSQYNAQKQVERNKYIKYKGVEYKKVLVTYKILDE